MSYLVEYDPVTFEAEYAAAAPDGGIETASAGFSGAGTVAWQAARTPFDGSSTRAWRSRRAFCCDTATARHRMYPSRSRSTESWWNRIWSALPPEPGMHGAARRLTPFHLGRECRGDPQLHRRGGLNRQDHRVRRQHQSGDGSPIAFSAQSPGYPASQAVDGDLRTFWRRRARRNGWKWIWATYTGSIARGCRLAVAGLPVQGGSENSGGRAYVQVVDRTGNTHAERHGTHHRHIRTHRRTVCASDRDRRRLGKPGDRRVPHLSHHRPDACHRHRCGRLPHDPGGIDAARHGDVIVFQPGSYPEPAPQVSN